MDVGSGPAVSRPTFRLKANRLLAVYARMRRSDAKDANDQTA
jgi:hypothetical protein